MAISKILSVPVYKKIPDRKVSWIPIVKPGEQELRELAKKYRLHPLIIEELRAPSARATVENHGPYLYLAYHFPIYDTAERVSRRSEIDFIITKKEVITVQYEGPELLEEIKKSIRGSVDSMPNTLQLTHKLLEAIISFQQRQLQHIGEKVDEISTELFRDRESVRERTLLEKISYLKRDISQYRIIVRPQKHLLESLALNGCAFLGEGCQIYINDLVGENMKILDHLEDYREAIEDFELTNNELISVKNAQVTKTFTILAFLTFPMMLLAALLTIETPDTPIVDHPQGFWIILGIMIASMGIMYAYFRRKDWI